MRRIVKYNPHTGVTQVILTDKYTCYVGKARTHPEDMDISSKTTGATIAELRARIKRAQSRRSEVKARIRKLTAELSQLENQLDSIENQSINLKYALKEYIKEKGLFQEKYHKYQSNKPE